jgi:RHS repeat-associated protein
VQKTVPGWPISYIYSGGSIISQYNNGAPASQPFYDIIYAGSTMLVTVFPSDGSMYYSHADHLSNRVVTDGNGNTTSVRGHYPFGELWYETGSSPWKFTTYFRDAETGLDYALARYYDSASARFCSADPLGGSPADPQSWNRYSYVENDPVNLTDPSGKGFWSLLAQFFTALLDALTLGIYHLGFGHPPGLGTPPFQDSGPLSDTTATLNSIYNPASLSGPAVIQNFEEAAQAASDRWGPCVKASKDWNIMHILSRQGYGAAKAAAANAKVQTSQVLGIWDIENSLGDNFVTRGAGDVGPMQVTPFAKDDLKQYKILPAGYDTDLRANVLAGARYYALNVNKHGVPAGQAAAAYHRGPKQYADDVGKNYQKKFDARQPLFINFVNCVEGTGPKGGSF